MPRRRNAVPDIEPGDRFGRWTAKPTTHGRKHYWNCVCDCGHHSPVLKYNLLTGKSTQCVICSRQAEDRVGQRFGLMTVIARSGRRTWICRCDCGREHSYGISNLIGRQANAGCRHCSQKHRHDKKRDEIIRACLTAGISAVAIARVMPITKQRVYQLIKAMGLNHEA